MPENEGADSDRCHCTFVNSLLCIIISCQILVHCVLFLGW